MPTDWISTDEASKLSGYHRDYIRQLIRQGKIKASRKGTMFWVDRAALLSFTQKSKKSKKADRRHGPHRRSWS